MDRIGIDLGGTKIEGIVLDLDGNELYRKRVLTGRDNGYQFILNRIGGLVSEMKNSTRNEGSLGICTPGAIDPTTGRLKNSNTTCLIDKPLKEDLEDLLGHTVFLENDANCFALAEAKLGAARGYRTVFGVIIGTGVGGGIVIDGKIHHGRIQIAGEWGHHTLYPNGRDCYCGQKGCVEAYISGPALEKCYTELTGDSKSVTEIADDPPPKWKQEFLTNFGIALSNVINILDPDAIVLGGGVSKCSMLYTEGVDFVYENVFSPIVDTPILQNKLGDSAGVLGAAWLGAES